MKLLREIGAYAFIVFCVYILPAAILIGLGV